MGALPNIDEEVRSRVRASMSLPTSREDAEAIRGGHNLTALQEIRLTHTLCTMWPEWREARKASRELGLRFIELRECFIAGCQATEDRP